VEHVDQGEDGGRQRDPLAKALQVLDVLVDHPEGALGVRELAGMLGTAPSTTHRVLTMLAEIGYVSRDDDGRYSVGFELQRLAWRVAARFPAPAVAEPVLRALTEQTGETSALGLFDPIRRQITFVAQVETQHRLRYMAELFHSIPIHAGASGLSILAFLDPALRDRILHAPEGLPAITTETLTTPEDLEAAMAEIRSRGYAITHGQRASGAVGIAAPVWNAEGAVLGNIMVTIPEQRFDPALEPQLSEAVLAAAQAMTRIVGGHAPLRTQ
jgi:DNA-binding IclR family transcriptional regulator